MAQFLDESGSQKRPDLWQYISDNDNPRGEAHGWIQWKGTNVCMDVHCKCGALLHADEEFFYFCRCGVCGQLYGVGQNVKLIPIPKEMQDEMTADAVLLLR